MVFVYSDIPGTNILGKGSQSSELSHELRGLGIQPKHVTIDIKGVESYIEPASKHCMVAINGKTIDRRTKLDHLVSYRTLQAPTIWI